ncbi:CsbD family protein [Propionibacterium freudenreichii]|uniref:CsbD family protein n=1 Tax=Propionibacterium freudenreichii TaxID=1744 RepID=UPI000542541A|nr:CsbD family protein [Propionibacterium freudenreichii]AJQ89995.1 Hypothetical protein RM25_0263 [Propionibacterium freudenreichii subsp. freudenreichii]MCT2995369.1 CsbD family protein [Propionibacterium freudenreichii]MDK9295995.1 CsbD family protein [Propionibacterium freudenreichii]MDK9343253.1 CsbD family protein [Propionibacterium freudenreichii]MDK9361387.1 CsbD family protein [Propionibacterium freudenreichii]
MNDAQSAFDKAAGKAKEVIGKVTGNDEMAAEGTTQNAMGKVEGAFNEAKDKVTDTVNGVKEGLKGVLNKDES